MNNWEVKQFSDAPIIIIDGDRGKNYPSKSDFLLDGYCVFLNTSNITKQGLNLDKLDYITQEKDILLSKGKVKTNDLIFTTRGTVGNSVVIDEMVDNYKFRINSGMIIVRPEQGKILSKYTCFYFNSAVFRHQLQKIKTGAAQPQISITKFKQLKIPLPPLPEQERIVAILDKAQELIDKRKQQLEEMDELVKSLFYDMFGDPVTNHMGWEKARLDTIFSVLPQNGLYKPAKDYVDSDLGVPILRIDAFYGGKITNRNFKRLTCSEAEINKFRLNNDDIVINRVNSIEYLGKCALVTGLNEPTVYESNMMRFSIDGSIANPLFISYVLSHKATYIQVLNKAKKAVNQASINQKDVCSLVLVIPHLDLQSKFASRVNAIEAEKERMQKSLAELEDNFEALMQRAFKGEL